jgi:hypothetical protein
MKIRGHRRWGKRRDVEVLAEVPSASLIEAASDETAKLESDEREVMLRRHVG